MRDNRGEACIHACISMTWNPRNMTRSQVIAPTCLKMQHTRKMMLEPERTAISSAHAGDVGLLIGDERTS